MVDEYGIIDFDGESFCMPVLEKIIASFREEMIERYSLFRMGMIWYVSKTQGSYNLNFGLRKDRIFSTPAIGNITVADDNIRLRLYETPINHNMPRAPKEHNVWCYTLADPKSLLDVFHVLDKFHEAWDSCKNTELKRCVPRHFV